MLDNILNTVRQGVEQVQRRGEELTQVARLRVEVFQLSRDLEGQFARLGRAYHNGADTDLLQGIQADIRRTEGEIRDREQLIAELGDTETTGAEAENRADRPGEPASAPAVVQLTPPPKDTEQTPPDLQKRPASDATSTATAPSISNRPAFVDTAGETPGENSSS